MIFASIGRSQYEIPAELLDHGLAPLAIPMVAMGWVGNFLELLLAPNDTPARPCARMPAGQDGGDQAARVAFMVDLFGEAGGVPAAKRLSVFRAELLGTEEADWEALFVGLYTDGLLHRRSRTTRPLP